MEKNKNKAVDDLTDITIKNILTDGIYNDLGFTVGDKIIIMVECQSTWTMNIIIRVLMYLTLSVPTRIFTEAKSKDARPRAVCHIYR